MQRLIVNYSDSPSFIVPWIRPVIEKYFNIVEYHAGTVYDPHNDFPLITYASRITNPWFETLVQKGHKLIVDHLWDSDVAITPIRTENELELRCPNWMWYLSSLEFEYHGYKSYVPQREKKHSFLMLMNNARWHRDALLNLLHNVLPTALYSYNSKNITMPGDNPEFGVPWQRYMNPDWYNHTTFSLVAESYMRNTVDPGPLYTEVSEKIFKPLSYRHPFLVAGSHHTLKYLKQQGFETFDTWFDESYDNEVNDRVRLAVVCNEADKAVLRWKKSEIGWDSETLRRLEHNHCHMFDRVLVERRFVQEIINPMLEFVCER